MADNVQADLATTSGAIFKTDQDSGDQSHAPFTKLMFGALNTFTVVDSTHGLPVEIVAGLSSLATAANQVSSATLLTTSNTLATAANVLLTAIEGDTAHLSSIDSNISVIVSGLVSIQSDLTTIGGYVDGLETLIGTTNTSLSTINAKITACDTGAVVIASGSVSISGSVAVTGTFWQATQPVSIAAAVAVTQSGAWTVAATTVKPDGTNTMPSLDTVARAGFVKVTDGTNTLPTMDAVGRPGFVKVTDGTNTMPTMDSTARPGFVNLNIAGVAVSSGTGNSGTGTVRVVLATDQPALTNTQPVKDLAQTSGGLSMHCSGPLANSNNATSVKASAGQVYAIQVFNVTATVAYLKLYNKASAPAPASDTPVKVIPIPANTSVGGVSVKWEKGLEFTTGIAYAVVTGISGTDNTSVAVNSGIVNIDYK